MATVEMDRELIANIKSALDWSFPHEHAITPCNFHLYFYQKRV
jgi:hypothetical protein